MVSSSPAPPSALPAQASAWAPLRHPVFRGLWIASVVSNVGTWVQNVGAAWLMSEISTPALVALVQTATSLPVFFLALPAGALADIVDRRRLMLWAQAWSLAAATLLGVLTLSNLVTPWGLLALTFAIGVGAAASTPAFQSVVPDVVPRADLPAAVALSSVSLNIARALGPALGGVLVAAYSPGLAFLVNAASFLATLVVVWRWDGGPPRARRMPEHLVTAMRSGLHYVRHAPAMRAVNVRTATFIAGGSALWALLPVRAQRELGFDALGYGVLLGAIGAGALAGAVWLPRLRARIGANRLAALGAVVFGAVTAGLGLIAQPAALLALMGVGGVAWLGLMSTFNVAVQASAPAWVKARALAVYLLVFQGGSAFASAGWGVAAERLGVRGALLLAAVVSAASALTMWRWPLATAAADLDPARHWPEPQTAVPVHDDRGPVLVTVEYQVAPDDVPAFRRAMQRLRAVRLRDGATTWHVMVDAADPARHVEVFFVDSWAEHLRQHDRVTHADRELEGAVRAFHRGAPPRVSHWLGGE
ncbi:MFS transporter [Luteitalea sp. TBR-22]|uniref:MFS transporter n=1 Tax=Luteitalea sp. TBR-22 TaxID=2802971 RepID=UPI001AFC033D|nr:MFS transporter [Luteitalea sp. TBR-22]BCS32606.1 MFS transporter [Luteitalea sp. TBR-22]